MQGPSVEGFNIASQFFVEVVGQVDPATFDGPGLGAWTLRELIAHANRAHTTIEEYLLDPKPPEQPNSGYFAEAAIAQRGREAVQALGSDPASALATTATTVRALVASSSPDATIGSPARTMTLEEYLPSRTAELTIHGIDVCAAIGREMEAPAAAIGESLRFVVSRAVARGMGLDVLLALSGRRELPPTFNVY